MFGKRFAILAVLLVVAGCAVQIPPPLTAEQRAAYAITRVVVVMPETAAIRWGRGEDQLLAEAGLAEADDTRKSAYLNTVEAQQALRARARDILQRAIEPRVRPALRGKRPMQVSVLVDTALTASPGRVLLLGGGHGAGGGAQLFDIETGEALSVPQRLIGLEQASGGITGAIIEAASRDPMIRVGERFGETIARWIVAPEPIRIGTDEDFNRRPLPALPRPEPAS